MSVIVFGTYSNFEVLDNSVHPEAELDKRLYFCPCCTVYRPAEYHYSNPWFCICFIPVFSLCQKREVMVCRLCATPVEVQNFIEAAKVDVAEPPTTPIAYTLPTEKK